MSNCNRCVRSLCIYITLVVGIACFTTGLAGHAVIKKYQDRQVAALSQVTNNHWQDHINELQDQCGHALDIVAAGMADEEFDSVPLEVWDSAYQRCLLDTGATI